MEDLNVPDSVTSIGVSAFYDTAYYNDESNWEYYNVLYIGKHLIEHYDDHLPEDYDIKSGTLTVADNAFEYNESLTSVTIPKSVTNIGNYAFLDCIGLTDVYYSGSESEWNRVEIGEGNECLTNAAIHFGDTGNGGKSEYASGSCGDNLTWVLYTDGTLTISGTGEMEDYSWSVSAPWYDYRETIKSAIMEDKVTSIGSYAFYGCTTLTSVSIPNSIVSIGKQAFENCSELTSVAIPDSVVSIGTWAFYGCNALESVWINSLEAWCNIDFGGGVDTWNPIMHTGYTSGNGNGTSNPMYYADDFYIDSIITTEIVVPNSVTTIKNYAFYGFSSLTNIILPETITDIGNYAFNGCSGLTNVTIPETVTSIGAYAFRDCSSINDVVIPDRVTSIGTYAFSGCSSLTSVTIADSVVSVGSYAFYDTAYYNDEANWEDNVLYIDGHLIKAQTSMAGSYNVKSGTLTIADNAFEDCNKITRVTMSEGVVNIGEYAFCNCKMMTSVTMPDSLLSIGIGAFGNCTNLESTVIPENVTNIGDYMFYGCSSLAKVTLPNAAASIGSYAFYECSKLTCVTLKESIKSIGEDAFYACIALENVYYTGTLDAWCNIDFYNYYSNPLYFAENFYINDVLLSGGGELLCRTALRKLNLVRAVDSIM